MVNVVPFVASNGLVRPHRLLSVFDCGRYLIRRCAFQIYVGIVCVRSQLPDKELGCGLESHAKNIFTARPGKTEV